MTTYSSFRPQTQNLVITGDTTLGDASGDTLTINAGAVSLGSNLNIDSNTLYIDATNNRIGIGTASPTHTLSISANDALVKLNTSNASDTITLAALLRSGTTKYELNLLSSNNLALYNYGSSTYSYVVGTNGRTAIGGGSTAPSSLLHVTSNSNTYADGGLLLGTAGVSSGWLWTTDNLYIKPNTSANTASGYVNIQTFAGATTISMYSGTGSLAIGGATPVTSGAGITFPATQSASSDANTLDDYEEGTWTPGYSPANGSSTITVQTGTYTKVGRMVCINFQVQFNVGTSTNIGQITNLPFTVVSGPNYIGCVGREYYSLGKASQYTTNVGGTVMGINFYDNSTAIPGGVTILGFAGSLTYFV